MKIIDKLQENVISAKNQNKENVYYYGDGEGFRILFVGNSITKHRPLGDWKNDCGMAASSVDKDYVHLLVEKCRAEYHRDTSFGISQVAGYECTLDLHMLETDFSTAKGYNPDVVIMFIGANAPKDYDTNPDTVARFAVAYEALRNHVVGEHSLVFHADGFYIRPVLDEVKKQIAAQYGDTYIPLEDIRSRVDTHGAYNHPGDLGMAMIADRFWSVIKQKLAEAKE